MEFIKNKLIALLGLSDLRKCLLAEINQLREDLEYLESQYDDTKYLAEDLESQVSELESRIDEKEDELDNSFVDLENRLETEVVSLKEEVNEVLTDFEKMTEGYTVSVKLNPPL